MGIVLLLVGIVNAGLFYPGPRSVWESRKTGEKFIIWKNCSYNSCTLVVLIKSNGIINNLPEAFDAQHGYYYVNSSSGVQIEFISQTRARMTFDDGSSSYMYLSD